MVAPSSLGFRLQVSGYQHFSLSARALWGACQHVARLRQTTSQHFSLLVCAGPGSDMLKARAKGLSVLKC